MATRRTRLEIAGMSCANCSATLEDALAELAGVESASINFATDEGTVTYDPAEVDLASIYDTIDAAGYEAIAETTTVGIADLSCANCAETTAAALADVPGVINAEVNYATDEAQIRYNPAETGRDAFYGAIERAGYTPVEADTTDTANHDVAREAEITQQRRLTIFGAALTTPTPCFSVARFSLIASPVSRSGGSSGCWQPPCRPSSATSSTLIATPRW